jgi:hypothetical protein
LTRDTEKVVAIQESEESNHKAYRMPVTLKTKAESAKENSSSGSWLQKPSIVLVFGIIVALSFVIHIRELKMFYSQKWIISENQIEAALVAPTVKRKEQYKILRVPDNSNEKSPAGKEAVQIEKVKGSTNRTETETATVPDAVEITKEAAKNNVEKPEEIKIPPVSGNSTGFKRYDRVAIVTKIHGPHQWLLVEQSMCLLHHAYNHKVLYDIVIFTASEIPQELIDDFEKMVAPAKVSIVMDNIGFQEEIAALTPAKHKLFLERCMVTDPVNLTWWSECNDPGRKSGAGRVAYNWQAEFRSVRIWEDPALEKYRYMLWLDSDGFPSKPWEKDPVEYFIENEGVIMFDNWPKGATGQFTEKILDGFNESLCDLHLNKEKGHFERNLINHEDYAIIKNGNKNNTVNCNSRSIQMIHGFFHITDLDFFRQPKVINGLKGLLGDCFLCRRPDDQLAVTVPPAIYAPEKSFDMRSHGFNLSVSHNFNLDGKEKQRPINFVKYWNNVAKIDFPSAEKACKITQGS